MKKAKGEVRRLLIVIGELQDKIGMAKGQHDNDRDMMAFEKAQKLLDEAFRLCIETTGEYERIETK